MFVLEWVTSSVRVGEDVWNWLKLLSSHAAPGHILYGTQIIFSTFVEALVPILTVCSLKLCHFLNSYGEPQCEECPTPTAFHSNAKFKGDFREKQKRLSSYTRHSFRNIYSRHTKTHQCVRELLLPIHVWLFFWCELPFCLSKPKCEDCQRAKISLPFWALWVVMATSWVTMEAAWEKGQSHSCIHFSRSWQLFWISLSKWQTQRQRKGKRQTGSNFQVK